MSGQDLLRPLELSGSPRLDRDALPCLGSRRFHRREEDVEAGALPDATPHRDVATMLRHDAMHDGQSQPGSLTDRFGGEEWLEDARLGGLVHPAAGIAHRQADEGSLA